MTPKKKNYCLECRSEVVNLRGSIMNSEKSCSNCKHRETCATNYCDAVWDRAYNIRDGKDCWTPNENQILNGE